MACLSSSSSSSSSSWSSSSSSSSTLDKYDVFLSFSSLDMKKNFAGHLCTALSRQYIKTFFIDHDNIPENEEMLGPLVSKAAIEKSKHSIIIFSKNYASSPWRLEELTHILECKGKMGHDVVPLFYNIEPSDVRTQQGSFATAFSLHDERFKHRMEKLQQWRNALRQASNLVGWDISEYRSESELVDAIVRDVQIIFNCKLQSVDFKDLVGIEKRIEEIKKLLCIGSHDIRIVGIWGMGGIGKTTLAAAVYNHLSSQFEDSYFLADIREKSKKSGTVCLQRKIINELFKEEGISGGFPTIVEEKERRKRVLLVLDDVDDSVQFELLAVEKYNQLGVGSRIIVTTRDAEVLRNITADGVYKVEVLNYDESMQLFHLNAFRNMLIPKTESLEESKRIVEYSEGLPLAIKTLGSHLHARSKYEWQSAITKLRRVPDMDVQRVLRKSYDSLDHKEREAFLDIACFHKGEDKEFVEQLLGCESFTHTIVDHLIDKCLVTIKHNKQLWMHNLVQQMGWEIVRQESIEVPGNRSRLWDSQDVYHVLQANKGTAATEGISLETSEISNVIEFSPTVFQEMNNLRLLKISSYDDNTKKWTVQFPQGLQSLPDALQYLHWDGYPLKCLPLNFTAKNLVGLILTNSHINDLPWHGVQDLRHLKLLDLSHSTRLTKVPDFYDQAPNLECIRLQFCASLAQVPSSLQHLNKLRILNLSGCSSIKEIPLLPRNIRNLDLSCTSIRQVPSSIDHLCSLETLDLKMCENLEFLPRSIFSLKSLKELNIRGCTKLKYLPELPLYQENLNAKCCTSRETEPTNSCSCLMFLSLVVDIFQHVRGRQSGSDKDPHGEEKLQAPEKVLQSIMTELGEHNKQISQHLQTVMPKTTHESFDSLEMSFTPRDKLSHSTAAEKQLHETPEETIDSLCSQIIGVRDQNNKILQNLQALLPTTPDDQFVGLFLELTPSLSAPSIIDLLKNVTANDQHVQVPEEVIHSLQSNLTKLRDQNQEILQFLCIAMSNSPTTTNRQSSQSWTTVTPEKEDGQASKDRRGSYKRRRSSQSWTIVTPKMELDQAWKKYGQKDILGAKYPRTYFRCTHRNSLGCQATRQVQQIQDNPKLFETTYIGHHTCRNILKATQTIISDCESPSDSANYNEIGSDLSSNSFSIVPNNFKAFEEIWKLILAQDQVKKEAPSIYSITSKEAPSSKDDVETRTVIMVASHIGNTEIPPNDGYSWQNYGQKEIMGSKYPRGYYRCTHQKLYNCPAKKKVQRLDHDPFTFEVTYRGHHTCHMSATAPSMSPSQAVIISQDMSQTLAVNTGSGVKMARELGRKERRALAAGDHHVFGLGEDLEEDEKE